MAIEQVERSLFRNRELSAKKLRKGDVLFTGFAALFPLIETFAKVNDGSTIELSSSSHDGDVNSEDSVLTGLEINVARIRTERTRLFTRKPILRYTP